MLSAKYNLQSERTFETPSMDSLGCDVTYNFSRVVDIQGVNEGGHSTQFIMEQNFFLSKLMKSLLW